MSVYENFGEKLAFCEPSWYQGFATPYYKEHHVQFRNKLRAFVNRVRKKQLKYKKLGEYPLELHEEFYKLGFGGVVYPTGYGGTIPEGAERSDYFHELILWDELARLDDGIIGSALSINSMAMPPVLKAGPQHLVEKICRPVIEGKTFMSLAISEPGYGSDVAGIETTAIKDGHDYIVNGNKKWITGGLWAEWFTVAVRTGGPGSGMKGLSLVLIHRDMPGVNVRKMETQADNLHNTTFVTLNNVRVPQANLIGKEGHGFKYIVVNFNHERWVIAVQTMRASRRCFEEAFKYALRRKTFGKLLVSHQVIRMKLAEMAKRISALEAAVERLTLQFNCGTNERVMGGQCALVKVQASQCFEFCAREASQIFGGAAVVREGKGRVVEALYRGVRASAIPGGSEEILLDFAIRQAIPTKARKRGAKM